jgi:hypothetical protein
MLESGIGEGVLIELATLGNFTYPGDLFPSDFHYRQDLTEPDVALGEDCTFEPSRVAGVPYKPVLDRIRTHVLHSKVIREDSE